MMTELERITAHISAMFANRALGNNELRNSLLDLHEQVCGMLEALDDDERRLG